MSKDGFISRRCAFRVHSQVRGLDKWVEPILTTVNVAAPYHARTLLFKYIHTWTYIYTSRAHALEERRVGEGESAADRDAASKLYTSHGAPTRAGLTCAFGCACTRRRCMSCNTRGTAQFMKRVSEKTLISTTSCPKPVMRNKSVTNRKIFSRNETHAEGSRARKELQKSRS